MNTTAVFAIHPRGFPWLANVADALRDVGVSTHLWLTGDPLPEFRPWLARLDRVVNVAAPPWPDDARSAAKHLARLEERVGHQFIHRSVFADRSLTGSSFRIGPSSLDHRRRFPDLAVRLAAVAENAERELLTYGPAFLIGEPIYAVVSLCCEIARANGVPFLTWFEEPYVEGRFRFHHYGSHAWPRLMKALDSPVSERSPGALAYADEALVRMAAHGLSTSSVAMSPPRRGRRTPLDLYRQKGAAHRRFQADPLLSDLPELSSIRERTRRFVGFRRAIRIYERSAIRNVRALPSPFVLYCLHVQPEWTVEVQSFKYTDQMATIRQLAASLPATHCLAVKEHGAVAGFRPPEFYRECVQLPNVELVHHDLPLPALVASTAMVVTLAGTIALEAAVRGTPVAVMGDTYYAQLPGVSMLVEPGDLGAIVMGAAEPPAAQEQLLNVAAARFDTSYAGRIPLPDAAFDRTDAQMFVRALQEELGTNWPSPSLESSP